MEVHGVRMHKLDICFGWLFRLIALLHAGIQLRGSCLAGRLTSLNFDDMEVHGVRMHKLDICFGWLSHILFRVRPNTISSGIYFSPCDCIME
jgi:hypothetical protein